MPFDIDIPVTYSEPPSRLLSDLREELRYASRVIGARIDLACDKAHAETKLLGEHARRSLGQRFRTNGNSQSHRKSNAEHRQGGTPKALQRSR